MRIPVLAVLLAAAALSASAQEPAASPSPATPPVFTAEQKQEAKQTLEAVGKALGVQVSPSPGAPAGQATGKTVADVLDKGLDLTASAVSKISGMLEQVAPKVWRIFVIQQYAKAISGIIVPWGMVFMCFFYVRLINKHWTLSEDERKQDIFGTDLFTTRGTHGFFTRFVPYTLAVVFGWWGFGRLADAALMAINPEYYAVKDLIQVLLAPGTL